MVIGGNDGQGHRLVRQRVGLQLPRRRPRRPSSPRALPVPRLTDGQADHPRPRRRGQARLRPRRLQRAARRTARSPTTRASAPPCPTIKYLLDAGRPGHPRQPPRPARRQGPGRPPPAPGRRSGWPSCCGKTVPVTGDALGVGTEDAVKRLRPGEVLLLENLRFHAEEEKNDPEFAAALAVVLPTSTSTTRSGRPTGPTPRPSASPKLLPAYAGFLMEREIEMLSKLLEDPSGRSRRSSAAPRCPTRSRSSRTC